MEPNRIWVLREESRGEVQENLIREFSRKEKIHPLIARLVLSRTGEDLDKAEQFLRPQLKDMRSPHYLPDMDRAIERTIKALNQGEKILIHGDYDVDGTCSVALLHEILTQMAGQSICFVPDRTPDGYGVSRRGIDWGREQGATLLITCDCGISALEEVDYANEKGFDVIITDHHLPGEKMPNALAVVNPQRKDSQYNFGGLCGTGVAFCFLVALRGRLREIGYFDEKKQKEPDLKSVMDLLALATIGDSVPLLEDNRLFVTKGLAVLSKTQRPGLRALLEEAKIWGKKLSTMDVAWKIVPRLNVAGRMGKANLALNLLLEKDSARASQFAKELDQLNQERKEIQGHILKDAGLQIKETHGSNISEIKALVLASDDWHPGVLGIVAARLSQKNHCPAVIITWGEEEGTGSVRSIPGINVVEALESCKEYLIRFGGHHGAAGLTLLKEQFEPFKKKFVAFISQKFSEEKFIPQILFDGEMPMEELGDSFLQQMEMLEPFGEANPEPLFAAYKVEVCSSRIVGKTHLKMRCRQGKHVQDAIGFGLGNRLENMGETVDLVFSPRFNEFRGVRSIQLEVKDLR